MAHLTPKENLLRLFSGEIPEWVPSYSYYGPFPGVDEPPPNMSVMNSYMMGNRPPRGETPPGGTFKDMWGVTCVAVEAVGGFALPEPGNFILDDITKWRDVIKAPDISGIDWEKSAKEDLERLPYSRDVSALFYGPSGLGFFQTLMSFMGFNEGLCAMSEEPEEVKELFAYMHNFYFGIAVKYIEYVQPDVLQLTDDTASERAPFISPDMFREFLLPIYDDYARLARNRGIPINFHNCGRSEPFFNDLVRIGITSWEPVQLSNDLHEIKKKFGRRLVLGGGWEARGNLLDPNISDEEIRQSVRDAIDAYAPGGGYMFAGAFTPGSRDDQVAAHKNEVLQKEVFEYGRTFYH